MRLYENLSKSVVALAAIISITACDKGTTSDPSTNDQGEFNPPGQLQTITGDGSIKLRWIAANAEKEFQGYHVFGTNKSVSELRSLATYPLGVDVSSAQSIPRCKDNSKFFEAFGFKATTTECKSSVSSDTAASTLFEGYEGFNVADSSSTSAAESEETIDFNLKCADESSSNVSRSGTTAGKGIGPITCQVSKLKDGTALANGTVYTFFVVAVKGEKFNNISWISNLVEDAPAKLSYSSDVTLGTSKYVSFSINPSTFAVTKSDDQTCSDNACKITDSNGLSGTAIHLARDNGGTYSMRWMVSSTGSIKLQARGPQTRDPDSPDTISVSIPGDQSVITFDAAGTKYAVYGNQVFDIELTNGTTKNYGKLVLKSISYTDVSSATSNSTVNVSIIMQPKTDSVYYLQ